jgi:exonuclease VII small subunit
LSRKVRQLAQLPEELDALGVVLRSATEPFDTGSAAGRMMLQMLAVFAEFEQATIVDRVTAGIERRATEGPLVLPSATVRLHVLGRAAHARCRSGQGADRPTHLRPLHAKAARRDRDRQPGGHCGKAYIGMSARGNGGRYEDYACTRRPKYGPKACRGERLPRAKLEHAVLRQLTSIYRDGRLIEQALAKAQAEAESARPEVEQRLASIRAEIFRAEQALDRYHEAFEQGKLSPERCEQRLEHVQVRVDGLREQEAELALETAQTATQAPTAADLQAVAHQLEEVLTEAEPQKSKALLRLLIQELRVNSRAEILPTYRLVTDLVCATSEKVARAGIEPATPRFSAVCSTN